MTDYDIIVVGGGAGGMTAALTAHELGCKVLLIEADKKLGGAMQYSSGVVYAAGTSVQRAAGIEDSPKAMYDYIMTLNAWKTRPDITRRLAEGSGPAVEWLIGLGAKYDPSYLVCSGVDVVPRGHPTLGTGLALAEVLIGHVGGQEIETILANRVEELILENGRVTGIRVEGAELRAQCVILATGGFGNNPELRERLFPSVAQHGERVFAIHEEAKFVQGDGITMGEAVGAAVVGHDTGMLLPSAGFGHWVEAYLPPWVMLINETGRRFMAENSPYAVSGYLINEQPGAHAFAIFDEPTLVEASEDKRFIDPYKAGRTTMTWDEGMIRRFVENGRIATSDTIAGLAGKIGVDPVTLEATLRRYNTESAEGRDTEYAKKAERYYTVTKPPYYAVEVKASVIGQTSAGLDIDDRARVRDVHGEVIPGLYAAGELLGCVQGRRYAGGGMGLCSGFTFGRLAGKEAAAEVKAAVPAE